jgi:DNA-binding MarR family transcriptional regulator
VTFTTNAGKPAPRPADAGRDTLIAELVDEMTSWSARDRMNAFKSWLKGSLSLIHLHVLTILEAEGPIPMSKLADTLDVSVASTTGIIGRMEERGLVERSHGETDRRVVLVQATAAGKAIFLDMTDHRRVALTALLGKLADDELAALLIGLRAMRTARAALHSEMAGVEAAGTAAAPGATVPSARPTKTLPAKEVRP